MTCSLNIQSDYDLQAFNTLSVPAVAEFFTEIKSDDDYVSLLALLKEKHYELLILGGGSNVLLPASISGIVAKIETTDRKLVSETDADIVMLFSAGENWHDIVMWSVDNDFFGLENLAVIPGSIGAAPIQNIGAYGAELKNCCEYVDIILLATGEKKRLTQEECQFAYRDSIFKGELKDKALITHVALKLKKTLVSERANQVNDKAVINIQYPALKSKLVERYSDTKNLTSKDIAHAVIEIRQSKLPDPKILPNVGSFFKNPIVSATQLENIKQDYPDVVAYPVDDNHFKLAAGWLIDKAGWKGRVVNDIAMHRKQALVLTNPQSASAEQVLTFAALVCDSIRELFNVDLEIEPRVF